MVTLPFSALRDSEVAELLKKHAIGLTVEEARKVETMLGRPPTIVEAVIWGIQGSEHCSYKSSKRFLRQFPTSGKHVILGPKEDAGIVAITDEPKEKPASAKATAGRRWGIVVSHESHNHPSQIVPYEGAATGIGGNVRDVACMGARVIGSLDALRLGDLATEESRTIAREVVRGIAGYGNALGVPTLGGDTQFHEGYNQNCLVNVVCLGIVREDEIIHSFVPEEAGEIGYDIILVGKPTDRSGFGGASFASLTLEEEDREKNTGAVQEPNPFLERHILAATYSLFDWLAAEKKLEKVSFKDLGAGGVVCSTVEQIANQGLGAEIDLGNVHTAMQDLPAEVIACAETQERFCWTCHPSLTEHILKHYNETWDLPSAAENARASVIGKVTKEPIYRLRFKGEIVCEAKALDITCGLEYDRPIKPRLRILQEPEIARSGSSKSMRHCFQHTGMLKTDSEGDKREMQGMNIADVFLAMLARPNHASKAPIFRHYDKNVQGNTVLECGEGDAGVIMPLQDLQSYVHEGTHPGWELSESDLFRGVAISCDGNGRYGLISPYWQGANAAIEAMRNVAAVGATPRALTDCLNYGNPEKPEELWELAEGVRGIADAAKGVALGNVMLSGALSGPKSGDEAPVPVISGNVSLYNESPAGSIPPSAIVSCIGVIPDARKAISQKIRRPDSLLFLLGERKDECGGSAYYEVLGELGANVPKPDFDEVRRQILFVTEAMEQGLILSCHDISEGGLLLALFEMLVPQRRRKTSFGIRVDMDTVGAVRSSTGLATSCPPLPVDKILFSETGGFVIEVESQHAESLHLLTQNHQLKLFEIGKTTAEPRLEVADICSLELSGLLSIWEKSLAKKLGL